MYIKQIWENRRVEKPMTYWMSTNTDGSITLTPNEGQIYVEGSKTNASRMNHIEDGIKEVENYVDTKLGNIVNLMQTL